KEIDDPLPISPNGGDQSTSTSSELSMLLTATLMSRNPEICELLLHAGFSPRRKVKLKRWSDCNSVEPAPLYTKHATSWFVLATSATFSPEHIDSLKFRQFQHMEAFLR